MIGQNDKPVLAASDLAVGYGGTVLIGGINLELRPGQIVTLIGPNGAGKSTVLKTAAGQLAAVEGVVYLQGRDLAALGASEVASSVAQVLTERPQTELLTCRDIVEVGRYPHTGRLGILSDHDHEAVRRAMEATHTWDLCDQDFMHISDGQRQRVMLARALCQEPGVLLLDEPTSYLDVHYQIELLSILRSQAKREGMAILMSLHELGLARIVSDQVICLRGDRVFAQGTPAEVFVPGVIDQLFDLAPGTYDCATGAVRLPDAPGGD